MSLPVYFICNFICNFAFRLQIFIAAYEIVFYSKNPKPVGRVRENRNP